VRDREKKKIAESAIWVPGAGTAWWLRPQD
jgi:hypothetical protein